MWEESILDIFKAFGKVWHDDVLFRLKTYGVEDDPLLLVKNYLKNGTQRVVLNSQISAWRKINSGVPEGLVPGPFLFLIYINDLPDSMTSTCKIFVDDTSLVFKVQDINKSAN